MSMNINRLGQELQRLYGANNPSIRDSEGTPQVPTGQANATDATSGTGAPGDSFQASGPIRDLARVLQIVKATPDVRADRVASLRQQISSGSYQVSAEG